MHVISSLVVRVVNYENFLNIGMSSLAMLDVAAPSHLFKNAFDFDKSVYMISYYDGPMRAKYTMHLKENVNNVTPEKKIKITGEMKFTEYFP